MKWFIYIALFISVGANSYFIYDEIQVKQNEEFERLTNRAMGGELSKTTWKQGLQLFTEKLKINNKALLNKKYFYINIWTNWCKPCIKEMPWLDSIAGTLNKDVGYVFMSDLPNKTAEECIKKKNYDIKNFIFLNDMSHFVDAICNEQGRKSKAYPMVLILSNDGKSYTTLLVLMKI
jgi:thiol-disulfide isomerase/thioredoxin